MEPEPRNRVTATVRTIRLGTHSAEVVFEVAGREVAAEVDLALAEQGWLQPGASVEAVIEVIRVLPGQSQAVEEEVDRDLREELTRTRQALSSALNELRQLEATRAAERQAAETWDHDQWQATRQALDSRPERRWWWPWRGRDAESDEG